ncbi:cell division topological specificity factor MinE [Desulfurobacterium sp.]
MGFWPFNRKPSKDVAKQRLQVILKYDRAGLPPNSVDAIKNAILNALKDFPFVDVSGIKINFPQDEKEEKIELEIPVKTEK